MSYTYLGRDANNYYRYTVTLKLYRICGSGQQIAELPENVYFTVYDKSTNSQVAGSPYLRNRISKEVKELGQVDPCIVNPPSICFQIGTYKADISVPPNATGYIVAFQSCCRDNFMVNIIDEVVPNDPNKPGTGATYFTELPGTNSIPENSSAVFAKDEAVLVCAGKNFTYDFSATDKDGDRLEYSFCDAYSGGKTTDVNIGYPPPADPPAYNNVHYVSPYSGGSPLGPDVVIDKNTGIISGVAPPSGKYVVTICVTEYRNNKVINIHRKDFHVNVTNCIKQVVAAMPEKYADCDSYTIQLLNKSTPGKEYRWHFGDGTSLITTSLDPIPHKYTQPGTYTVKLYVDSTSSCGDSAMATAFVYPFLQPDFTFNGLCIQKLTQFTDRSVTNNAIDRMDYYRWDFGDDNLTNDTSLLTNPTFQYAQPGTYNVELFMRTLKGCERTVTKPISVYDKPPLFTTNDTLLCKYDALQLKAESTQPGGTYSWTPNVAISGANTPTPTVRPLDDIAYTVTYKDVQNCTNEHTINIDVRAEIHVSAGADSTVCTGDPIPLRAIGDGDYSFSWRDLTTNTEIGTTPNIIVTPPHPGNTYEIEASLGTCKASDFIILKVVDPPKAFAGNDTTICYGEAVMLHATGGAHYRWTPGITIEGPTRANTPARPKDTTVYTVIVTDDLGCPKEVSDEVKVNVVPQVHAFAGNDTIVIKNQPFQLHATGAARYTWTPADGLNNTNIPDPITTINKDFTYQVTAYTVEGCKGSDDIHLRFMTGPEIYIPTAFSPNGDGLNDKFRPLPVGIVKMEFFRVFDRWGKLMFSTTEYMKGWDGTVNGLPANIGTYAWVVQGENIKGETVLRKGTVTLVR
jgi:gliding motility-associated-like protein